MTTERKQFQWDLVFVPGQILPDRIDPTRDIAPVKEIAPVQDWRIVPGAKPWTMGGEGR